ncbi:MAG: glucose-1-phosphate adenylyltransferase [bacterium]
MHNNDVLVMILAGGEGKRLNPLTRDRAKPAVPFGGRYRIIDFVLNNFVNSGFYKIKIMTQYKSDSLNKHVARGWYVSPFLDQYIDLVPAQMRKGCQWYTGTADAIYQNINIIYDENPEYVCVFGGDHVFKMDVRQMLEFHKEKQAELTISAIPVPISEAHEFGIIEVDENWKLIGFEEKPTNPKPIPGRPDYALVSMGNYIFNKETIVSELESDAIKINSNHDFGKDIINNVLVRNSAYVYDFSQNTIPGETGSVKGYWKDVGNIDAYWQANMDLLSANPEFNLYNKNWNLRTFNYNFPPAKFIWEENERVGMATNSLVSEGCIISGAQISRCVLSPNVRINSYSHIRESILMEDVVIGRYAEIQKAIIDKNVNIPPYTKIGYNREEDIARGFYVSESGVTVVPKGAIL